MLDQIDAMVRQANPEPDPLMLNADDIPALLFTKQGSMEMKTVADMSPETEKSPKGRGVIVAMAAAAVVLIVGAVMYWQPLGEEVAAPQDLAVEFAQARASHDVDAVMATLSPDAAIHFGPANAVEDIPLEMEWQQASGLTFTFDRCEMTGDTGSCYVLYNSAVATAGGYGEDVFEYSLEIADGLIVSAELVELGHYSNSTWGPFSRFIVVNHQEDHDTMYMYWEDITQVSPEAVELWRTYTAEYVALHS
ncbi:MAG: hypothetical protein ACR2N7_05050 [Acidimicrobiia bacterium]